MDGQLYVEEGIRDGTVYFHADDGHSYHYNRIMRGGRISLRCYHYKKKRCRGRASVSPSGNDLRYGRNRHNHDPDRNLHHCRRFRNTVLNECRKAENSRLSLKSIFHTVRRSMRLPRNALVEVPYHKLKPSMRRARNGTLPNLPHTLTDLAKVLDAEEYKFLTTTLDGEDNIYLGKFGQRSEGTRVVIFASQTQLNYLRRVRVAFSDATFSSVPAALKDECAQVWSIVALRRHHVIPLVRVLMQTKSQPCYEVALRAIRIAAPWFEPVEVMGDFETAQANAWAAVFPLARLDGCLFHSSKAIAGKAKELELTELIRTNDMAHSIVRSTCTLALLPHNQLEDGLEAIVWRALEADLFDELEAFFEYIRTTWFRPTYKRMFSVYGCPDRTNNACESSNASLRAAFESVAYPNIWNFLYGLVHLEDVTAYDLEVLNAGYNVNGPRRSSVLANDAAIKGLYEDLEEGNITISEFLQRASHRVTNVYNQILNL